MKSKGPELGNLSSRFFSYVQLRKLDIVRTGEIAPILDISASQERDLFRRLSDSGWILRLKRGVYLVPPRIPAGGKYSPGVALILQKLMEEVRGIYQICGPSAFNFYGLDDQIPSVTYLYNNRGQILYVTALNNVINIESDLDAMPKPMGTDHGK